ncbi:hypothetical protein [Mycobacterium intracellulare]|uniref:hypothetical protein n=1 Tax=Mycobacterium intracellulare TaxID=1767 RepID=UPI003364B40D
MPFRETRTLRKVLESSSRDGASLLTDGRDVYGLGRLRSDYPALPRPRRPEDLLLLAALFRPSRCARHRQLVTQQSRIRPH